MSDEAHGIQIVGIDCAAQSKGIGIAVSDGSAVELVTAGQPDPARWITDHLDWSRPVILAMDSPLGWPAPLARSLHHHRAGEVLDEHDPNQLFRRTTDRAVHRAVGRLPLEVGADRIARTAAAALRLLREIREHSERELPLLWAQGANDSGVIEVYPAATLRAHGLKHSGYKRPADTLARQEILDGLTDKIIVRDSTLPIANADALDAVVCVLAAMDFINARCLKPPAERAAVEKEGWIWVRPK